MAADGGFSNSRFNALTHGIFRNVDLLAGDDKAAFAALHAALVEDHEPEGAQAELWVRELAIHEWRLALCVAGEGAILAEPFDPYGEAYEPGSGAALEERGRLALAAIDDPRMAKLLRYHVTFERARKRTYDMLRAHQEVRRKRADKRPPGGGLGGKGRDEAAAPEKVPGTFSGPASGAGPSAATVTASRPDGAEPNPPERRMPASDAAMPEPVRGSEKVSGTISAPPKKVPDTFSAELPVAAEQKPARPAGPAPQSVDDLLALAGGRMRAIEDALEVIAKHGADGYDAALAKLDGRMRRWWDERRAGGRDVGDTCFEIDHWERQWIGKATAAGLREWLRAVRWSDGELQFRVSRGF